MPQLRALVLCEMARSEETTGCESVVVLAKLQNLKVKADVRVCCDNLAHLCATLYQDFDMNAYAQMQLATVHMNVQQADHNCQSSLPLLLLVACQVSASYEAAMLHTLCELTHGRCIDCSKCLAPTPPLCECMRHVCMHYAM